MKATLASELDTVNEMESRLIESQKRLYGMDLEKENQEEQVKGIRERRNEAEETRQAAGVREKNAVESLSSLNQLRKNREADLAGFRDRLKEIEGNILTLQKTIGAAEERLKGNTEESRPVDADLMAEEKRREGLQENLRTLTDDIVNELDRGLKESGYDRTARRALEESIIELAWRNPHQSGRQGQAALRPEKTLLRQGRPGASGTCRRRF